MADVLDSSAAFRFHSCGSAPTAVAKCRTPLRASSEERLHNLACVPTWASPRASAALLIKEGSGGGLRPLPRRPISRVSAQARGPITRSRDSGRTPARNTGLAPPPGTNLSHKIPIFQLEALQKFSALAGVGRHMGAARRAPTGGRINRFNWEALVQQQMSGLESGRNAALWPLTRSDALV